MIHFKIIILILLHVNINEMCFLMKITIFFKTKHLVRTVILFYFLEIASMSGLRKTARFFDQSDSISYFIYPWENYTIPS